ncbi:MAG: radical SAM protein [Paramuribaculum sp.]|nr:radical SAM protein [Paramuribaculum sp.]
MDKIKRFIDIQIPVTTCNLRCHYCYITQHKLFASAVPPLKYSPEHIRKALSKERLGGICHFNVCGCGETLLPKYMTALIRGLLEEGHYIMIVNNGTISARFREMMEQYPQELKSRLGFKFSFHYLELKKRNLMDVFFSNIELVRNSGCSFSVELTPSDELIPHIDDVKRECMERLGALCHITVARNENEKGFTLLTKLSREDYIKTWGQFDSTLFDFKISIFNQPRKEFCHNGLWGGILDLSTGILRGCDKTYVHQDILKDIDKPINFRPIGICKKEHCHNGHAWLGLGMIPELSTPAYADMRDRVDANGNHWLRPEMYAFLSQKLCDANAAVDDAEKEKVRSSFTRKYTVWKLKNNLIYRPNRLLDKLNNALRHKNQ